MRKRPAIPWATAILVRPIAPPSSAQVIDIPEDQVPDLRLELPAIPPRLMTTRSAPPRPRGTAPASNGTGADSEKSESSLITPQLSAEETMAAQQQANQSLSIAERNLLSVRGRLNAAQTDLVSKIRGFLKDAHEAAQAADWARARTLSKKAQVLSEELVASR